MLLGSYFSAKSQCNNTSLMGGVGLGVRYTQWSDSRQLVVPLYEGE
jgi:hypothetical protein